MSNGGQMYCQDPIFISFEYMSRSGIAGSYDSSIFNCLRNIKKLSTVAAPIYLPNNSTQGFLFLHILTKFCYLLSLW